MTRELILTRRVQAEPPRPDLDPTKRYFRGLHAQTEGGREPAYVGAPAVIPAYTDVAIPMTESIQWMSYDLMHHFCTAADKARWRILHGHAIAMNNKGAGYGYQGNTLRDYVNGLDLGAVDENGKPALPKYDKIRTFQGSIISGYPMGSYILCQPGVDGIDSRSFVYPRGTDSPDFDQVSPEAQLILKKIIANQWYSVAIGTGDPPYHFRSQWGSTCWIVYPFLLDRSISFLASFFAEWHQDTRPEPLKTYNPT